MNLFLSFCIDYNRMWFVIQTAAGAVIKVKNSINFPQSLSLEFWSVHKNQAVLSPIDR